MEEIKRIAMIAHDNRKADLIEWVEWNWEILQDHEIICTGTTGRLVEEALNSSMKGKSGKKPEITRLIPGKETARNKENPPSFAWKKGRGFSCSIQ